MQIRLLAENQARDSIPALSALLVDAVESGASMGFMSPFTVEESTAFWDGVVAAVVGGTTALLAAVENDVIEGSVQVKFVPMANQRHRVDISKLLVHRSARGRGISSQLMRAAEDVTREAGRYLMVLDTATGSLADLIYPHLGWQRSGVIPNYALNPDGSMCDTTFYWKDLREAGGSHAPQ